MRSDCDECIERGYCISGFDPCTGVKLRTLALADKMIELLEENGFHLVPWQANMIRQWFATCARCEHPRHAGYRCGAPLTQEIRDDVGYGGAPPSFITRTIRVGTCNCRG